MTVTEDRPVMSFTRTEMFEIEDCTVRSPGDIRAALDSLIAKLDESRDHYQLLDASLNVQLTVISAGAM